MLKIRNKTKSKNDAADKTSYEYACLGKRQFWGAFIRSAAKDVLIGIAIIIAFILISYLSLLLMTMSEFGLRLF